MLDWIWGLFESFAINGITDAAVSLFNWVLRQMYTILTADWGNLGNNVAVVAGTINSAMVAIGVPLVSVLTLANMMKSSTNYMELKRPEMLIRVAFRLIVGQTMVIYSYRLFAWGYNLFASVIRSLFSAAGMGGDIGFQLTTSSTQTYTLDGFAALIGLLLVLIAFVVMVVICFSVLLTVMGRFFKIYFYGMLAPIPLATLACDGADRIGKNYLFSFMGVCFEGLVIAGAAVIFSAYLTSSNFLVGADGTSVFADMLGFLSPSGAQCVGNQLGLLINMSIFSGMVKGSDRIVREMVGMSAY